MIHAFMKIKPVTDDDKLFYFGKHFFTLDGLWIIEVEKEVDFETALKVDLEVWKKLFKIAYRRIKERLEADVTRVDGIIDVLAFRWSCEDWDYSIDEAGETSGRVTIKKCPYHEIMSRNPDRHDAIPRICKDICIPIYQEAVRSLNPDVTLERTNFKGLGDEACDFQFVIKKA